MKFPCLLKTMLYKSLVVFSLFISSYSTAQNTVINGPSGSGQFGNNITVLPNGNYVVFDPLYDSVQTDIGAVYLFNGKTHAMISKLMGSTDYDQIGNDGITILPNGNYVIISTSWDNGSSDDAGAVTWCSATTGCSGIVSSSNSLVGTSSGDLVGYDGITILSNGNYVVRSRNWDNSVVTNAGAVTWCNGNTGLVGVVSSSNSMVGSFDSERLGSENIVTLNNGNYIILSPSWDNGGDADVGAVTWCDGTTGRIGVITPSNSLVGTTANDQVGNYGVTKLNNGNYVVKSSVWKNGSVVEAGAVTWCDGKTGRVGAVSSTNSLVGSSDFDNIGNLGVEVLSNGNYVVRSSNWNNGIKVGAGAVTWCDGKLGRVGVVSITNSLVGSSSNDFVGNSVFQLSNGNYVVCSSSWDQGANSNVGAVTWCDGTVGRIGTINISNSLLGVTADDQIGSEGISVLSNGNYIVQSPYFDNGVYTNVGAVTWCSGSIGRMGVVSSSNSLVGADFDEKVGLIPITILNNGNYVVCSPDWNDGLNLNAGAVTWCKGDSGRVGVISSSNSLVGSYSNDFVGSSGVYALNNGHYVVSSFNWSNGPIVSAGAVTWCNGTIGRVGKIDSTNSLIGFSANDQIGNSGIKVLNNSNYVVMSNNFDRGSILNVGAVTLCNGNTGTTGVVSISNSLTGSNSYDMFNSEVKLLSNGNYIVQSPFWDSGSILNVGAMTWCSGTTGKIGTISGSNSLIGSKMDDQVGDCTFTSFNNGYSVFNNSFWDNGTLMNSGAVTIAPENSGLSGTINSCNSVLGLVGNPSRDLFSTYNSVNNYLIVGKPAENKIVIRKFDIGSSFSQTTCANQPVVWNGVSLNTSGAYQDTFPSFLGCDSIVTMNLTVTPLKTSSFNQTICSNQKYLWNGIQLNTSGAYKDTFPAFIGCDSVVTLNLTVTPMPSNSTTTTGKTITASEVGATYQWINCANNAPISGATAASYTPDMDGSYKVVVTKNGCVDTSVCTTISGVRILDINASEMGIVYPNPADREMNIQLHSNSKFNHIRLYALDGKEILNEQFQGIHHRIDVSNIIPGLYMYELEQEGKKEMGKLHVQH